jgi:small subunit ribosomal protein S8e
MSVWHGNLKKKKPSGGRKRAYRRKRKFEKGFFPVETELGKPKRKNVRGRSKNFKVKILSDNYACVSDKKNGKTEKVKIIRVIKNSANPDYNRRGVITRGAIIETTLGLARVTSRPGQDGVINALPVGNKEKS